MYWFFENFIQKVMPHTCMWHNFIFKIKIKHFLTNVGVFNQSSCLFLLLASIIYH